MDKATAQKLKDAGFESSIDSALHNKSMVCDDGWVSPNLSELIYACGDGFETLYESGYEDWWAGIYNWHDSEWVTISKGKTAEIAVAKLWLSMNT